MKLPSLLLASASLLLPALASAQVDVSQVWINPGFYSLHFDRNKGLEDFNPGIGIEWPIDKTFALTAGAFRNSDRDRSHYVGLYVMPFEFHGVKLGAVVGGFDGYQRSNNGGWFPALIPTAAIEGKHWGLNIAIVPTIKNRLYGAISFQLKYRFSDGS
ncbi:hypothetical protein QTI24_13825 [Variovorax sp. J22P240]|uniref:hypothetical protein n=1 Tax=Variovorax sp. J22P240 TaxID=3053514 RepID=UPI002577611D|nr:hypothetical protein [Variovorax sp. J22P240]MDL9999693.1 hypothetical protein [Variovorax sp. J22P240]